eukprot:Hpha_TRINITY_DN3444_c0_g1::TRINITY_DN3444_c0_g1_i1::g.32704::m.32704/K10967/KTR1_3; alpha 1,2-mannosyltransferase
MLAAGRPLPNVLAALRGASSSGVSGWSAWEDGMLDLLSDAVGVDEVVSVVLDAALVRSGKTHPAFFVALARALGVSAVPGECPLAGGGLEGRAWDFSEAELRRIAAACAPEAGGTAPPRSVEAETVPGNIRVRRGGQGGRTREVEETGGDGVIVYLCCGEEEEIGELRTSLRLLSRNFLPSFDHHVVIFYSPQEGVFGVETRRELQGEFPMVRFEAVEFPEVPRWAPKQVQGYGVGYRQMCWFFSGGMVRHPALRGYRWVMRLDSDSYFYAPVVQDPMRVVREAGVSLATAGAFRDNPVFVEGLLNATTRHFGRQVVEGEWGGVCYGTHLTVLDMRWARAPAFQNYLAALEREGGFWRARWGDACVLYLAAAGLLPSNA